MQSTNTNKIWWLDYESVNNKKENKKKLNEQLRETKSVLKTPQLNNALTKWKKIVV